MIQKHPNPKNKRPASLYLPLLLPLIVVMGSVIVLFNGISNFPSANLLNLDLQNEIEGPAYTVTANEALSLDIRNGSEVVDKAGELGERLLKIGKYTVINISSAANNDYIGNTIVNLSDKKVDALARELGAEVVTALPEGEVESHADIVIILGNQLR